MYLIFLPVWQQLVTRKNIGQSRVFFGAKSAGSAADTTAADRCTIATMSYRRAPSAPSSAVVLHLLPSGWPSQSVSQSGGLRRLLPTSLASVCCPYVSGCSSDRQSTGGSPVVRHGVAIRLIASHCQSLLIRRLSAGTDTRVHSLALPFSCSLYRSGAIRLVADKNQLILAPLCLSIHSALLVHIGAQK